eukprot:jgi/Psemu1/285163/fgenesh1_pg.75_\
MWICPGVNVDDEDDVGRGGKVGFIDCLFWPLPLGIGGAESIEYDKPSPFDGTRFNNPLPSLEHFIKSKESESTMPGLPGAWTSDDDLFLFPPSCADVTEESSSSEDVFRISSVFVAATAAAAAAAIEAAKFACRVDPSVASSGAMNASWRCSLSSVAPGFLRCISWFVSGLLDVPIGFSFTLRSNDVDTDRLKALVLAPW